MIEIERTNRYFWAIKVKPPLKKIFEAAKSVILNSLDYIIRRDMMVEPKNKDVKWLLKKGLDELGFSCSEEQVIAFMAYLSELKRWNRAYNLTALKADEDIIIKHFLDSLLYLKAIEEIALPRHVGARNDRREVLKMADAGTGAGFPGIPIKIMRPEINMTLIESSRKKSAFLRHIIRVLKLNGISILNDRIEALGEGYKKTFDVIVSRAAFKVMDFFKKACPYVKEGGWLVLSKGPKLDEGETIFLTGLDQKNVIKELVTLPFIKVKRNLLMLRCQNKKKVVKRLF